ncbi:hypothetical protein DPMN_069301 [Dreissena polymorpha]|uniref:Uncharacterized protein n=1 Tax=Dreissena polymorpha TaxID=45954 RepID=A0A9D3Z392_DREPO|nr:hypothetical protein DPMN_069301 [Dreissena polymorpha]
MMFHLTPVIMWVFIVAQVTSLPPLRQNDVDLSNRDNGINLNAENDRRGNDVISAGRDIISERLCRKCFCQVNLFHGACSMMSRLHTNMECLSAGPLCCCCVPGYVRCEGIQSPTTFSNADGSDTLEDLDVDREDIGILE